MEGREGKRKPKAFKLMTSLRGSIVLGYYNFSCSITATATSAAAVVAMILKNRNRNE